MNEKRVFYLGLDSDSLEQVVIATSDEKSVLFWSPEDKEFVIDKELEKHFKGLTKKIDNRIISFSEVSHLKALKIILGKKIFSGFVINENKNSVYLKKKNSDFFGKTCPKTMLKLID